MSKSVHVHIHGALTQDDWTTWNKNHAAGQKPQRAVPLRHQVANHQREMGSFLTEHGKTQAEFDKLKKDGYSPNEIRMLWQAQKRGDTKEAEKHEKKKPYSSFGKGGEAGEWVEPKPKKRKAKDAALCGCNHK